ncbi:MAG TPA: rod shape-determining protein RodA [Candidatus Paceibacterota bacterium]|nr:rod shape-determining protein RodA [Candidatus Paceibacterota bacterium]HMP19178.1 rod shape-determining protein RodA [Candidatus Paceibacterota bacterium]HMP85291.1 rod shape-determining protein RodA [Candidatus Paceibacterota bacterium]
MTSFKFLIKNWLKDVDWILLLSVIPVVFFGLITMYSFVSDNNLFSRQVIWFILSICAFFIFTSFDFKFLKNTQVVFWIYLFAVGLLASLFFTGSTFKGARSWIDFGIFAFQPVDFAKIALILILAKYFSRRHIEIKNIRHIIVSGVYALVLFALVGIQPDFGSAILIFLIWFGMVFVSGISKKHLLMVFVVGITSFLIMWNFVFMDYQKDRIKTFLDPLHDIQGAGYNAYQSMITVGSGQIFGKGIGYGTQSRLKFLPEYQTDFIFAAFAEEWGFFGVILLFSCYGILIFRILYNSLSFQSNFESLFAIGLAILFSSHFIIHVGMNVGLLPVTGLNLPFMSYGGTSLLFSFISLGILNSMRKNSKNVRRNLSDTEIVGF